MRWKGAAVSRPELPRILDACDAVGTESALYRTTGTVFPFPENCVLPNVWLQPGSNSHGRVLLLRL